MCHCTLVSCLSVQGLKVLNSRSTVRELPLEDVYQNTLLCSSSFARLFNLYCCNNTLFQCMKCGACMAVVIYAPCAGVQGAYSCMQYGPRT